MRTITFWAVFLAVGALILLTPGTALAEDQPPPRCEDVLRAYNSIVYQWHCVEVPENSACYGNATVRVDPPSPSFRQPGSRISFSRFDTLETITRGDERGAALLVADTSRGQVKIYAMGNTHLKPGNMSGVFSLYRTNGVEVCERTPSGLLLQTDAHKQGKLTVDGVSIDLGSSAYVSVEGDLLFDQDPRIGRRQGSRNPDAPLCSGFDSECNFADCPTNGRLVWGPYCREDIYPYIRTGLYRVTLFGRGQVTAGATDYAATGKMFSIMSRDLTLPASYTFCWSGKAPGGTGFETIVLARSGNARIDHLRLEFLGADCGAASRLANATPELLTVTNLEGRVTVSAAGVSRSPAPGQVVRVHFVNGVPRRVDPPVPATALPFSPLLRELTWEILPRVNAGSEPYPSEPSAPPPDTPPEPQPSGEEVFIQCGPADSRIDQGGCVELWWDVEHVRAVYLDGGGVTGHEHRTVCPSSSHRYELRAVTDQREYYCYMNVDVVQRTQDTPPSILTAWSRRYFDAENYGPVLEIWAQVVDDHGVQLVQAELFYPEDTDDVRAIMTLEPMGDNVYHGAMGSGLASGAEGAPATSAGSLLSVSAPTGLPSGLFTPPDTLGDADDYGWYRILATDTAGRQSRTAPFAIQD